MEFGYTAHSHFDELGEFVHPWIVVFLRLAAILNLNELYNIRLHFVTKIEHVADSCK